MSDVVVPMPPEDAIPINAPESVTLDPGERAMFRWVSEQRQSSGFYLPTLGISKFPQMTYRVWIDGSLKYGPAAVPPTDIDDAVPTFMPAYQFESELRVQVTNVSESTTRRVTAQPIGWEEQGGRS